MMQPSLFAEESCGTSGLYGKGIKGQIVVLAGVRFDTNSTHPLAQFTQPYFFSILSKSDQGYILANSAGSTYSVSFTDAAYLHVADEWIQRVDQRWKRYWNSSEARQRDLDGKLELLRDILIAQGVRGITKEQAVQLGIMQLGISE